MNDVRMVCFDLNKTLIEENTWRELNLAMGVTQREDDLLMQWANEGIIDDQTGQDILCAIYRARGDASKEKIESIISKYTLVDGAREVIDHCRSKGYEIALISGAMESLVENVASRLGIEHWRAGNKLVYGDDGVLQHIEAAPSEATNKADQLKALCTELQIDTAQVVVVGDGSSDAELFKLTGKGITFENSTISELAWKTVPDLRAVTKVL